MAHSAISVSANGESAGPVTVNVGDDISIEVVATACESVQGNNSAWRYVWVNAGNPQQEIYATSPCSVQSLNRSVSFDSPGTFTVSFISEYCRNYRNNGTCKPQWKEDRRGSIEIIVLPPLGLTCFNDDYIGGELSPEDWVTSVASGSFTPSLVNGRLRMTQAVSNQSTAATLQREIPGADNLVILEFDYYAYGGNGADGLAVVLSDAAITPQPGSFGGSLGYAQRNNGDAGFAGGWIGIGLDEFGNFSNPTEGRVGGPGFRSDAVAIRGAAQGGYRYLRGTNSLNPGIDQPGNNPGAQRYRITIDSRAAGEAIVSVERDTTGTGNNFQTLVAPFDALDEPGQPAVPENFLLSLTGSTGGSTNIHELDDVQLCALRLNPVGAQVDHFEILHDGTALTCQPETVTIRACATPECTGPGGLFTDPVVATLAPASGWAEGNPVTITAGVGQATLQNTAGGAVTLDVIGSDPSTRPQAVTLCDNGSGSLSSANCELPFFEAGLAFDVPDLTSHRPSGPIQVRAVRQDQTTQACVPAFENETKPVQFWSGYLDPGPGGRPASRALEVNGAQISGDSAAPTTLDLVFGPGGVAEIDVRYPDAGLMQLDGWYLGSEATGDAGLVMPGSDSFVSVPAGLCVSAAGVCAAGDSSCSTFVRADEAFDLSITAVGWQSDTDGNLCQGNPTTPNFSLANIGLSSQVVAPAGGEDGDFAPTNYTHNRSADAEETIQARVSEVGVFRFNATPVPNSYFGRTVPGGLSAPIGRFYPDRFQVSVDPGELQPLWPSCTVTPDFGYLGQGMGWMLPPLLQIEPLSLAGTRTRNYTTPGFQRLDAAGIERTFPVADEVTVDQNDVPLALTSDTATGALSVIEPGLMEYRYSAGDTFSYVKTPASRVESFLPELLFSIPVITDSDNVQAAGAPFEFQPQATSEVVYGRLVMENAYGPENIAELAIPFRLERWQGGRFVLNSADSCTPWNTAAIANTGEHSSLVADSGRFVSGQAGPLALQPLGSQGTDTLTWSVPVWLQDDVDGDGSLEDPTALATFGVYRGHDRVIYWQER
ncbi:MAG TPA: DUF6701 domain-containing protein [Marinobacter sp.]|nr:DUF6701 domain-containing protein [Marinobacter sp.]